MCIKKMNRNISTLTKQDERECKDGDSATINASILKRTDSTYSEMFRINLHAVLDLI